MFHLTYHCEPTDDGIGSFITARFEKYSDVLATYQGAIVGARRSVSVLLTDKTGYVHAFWAGVGCDLIEN